MDDDDRLRRQLRARIELLNRSIIPGLDFAKEDFGDSRTIELEVARLDAFKIDDWNVATDHGRELEEPILFQLIERKWHVARAERHGLVLDLLDAAARTDRLIVQAVASLFLVGVRPLGIDRIWEGRTGAGNVDSDRLCQACRRDDACGREGWEQSHASFSCPSAKSNPARAPVPRRQNLWLC